jgi:dihydrofolate synthase/folylpolyglutamate synthase
VDVAVLEIGLGGRLDAFNAIDANVAVITSIDLVHRGLLGSDREAIGLEKAGILRPGQKVVLGPDMPQSLIGACEALNLAPLCQGVDFSVERTPAGDSWQLVVEGRILDRVLRLGACAPSNLSLAYLACRDFDGVRLEHLALASAAVTLPGRLQALVFCGRTVIADVAHNPAGVAFLQAELEARGIEPHCVVFGMFADKDAAGVFAALRDYHALPWLLLDTIGDRGMPGRVLAGRLGLEGAPAGSLNELRGEMLSATDVGDVILAFGSFNVVEQCLAVMAHRDA